MATKFKVGTRVRVVDKDFPSIVGREGVVVEPGHNSHWEGAHVAVPGNTSPFYDDAYGWALEDDEIEEII